MTTGSNEGPAGGATLLVALRVAILVVLAASGALFAQYLFPAEASFCAVGSSCDKVRASGLGYLFGLTVLNVPLVGLLAYGALLVISLQLPRSPWVRYLSVAGALVAVGLVAVQAYVVQAYCWLCLVVDGTAFVVAGASIALGSFEKKTEGPADPLKVWAWGALAALAAATPVLWVRVKPAPPVPDVIAAEYVPGAVNVVEFADFECPHCRKFHPRLKSVLAEFGNQVRFSRKHVPLESHEHALPAARAMICAEPQGKSEALGDELVREDLSDESIRRAILAAGVEPRAFEACLSTQAPDRRIAADTALLDKAGFLGLPTTYIQGKRILGVTSEAALEDAIRRAARGETENGVPSPVFVGVLLAALGAVGWLGRARGGKIHHEPS